MTKDKLEAKSRHSIHQCITSTLSTYFADMDGHDPSQLYALVLSEVEKPMLEVVLQHTQHNITKSAKILGMSRATLHKRLVKYGLG